MVSLCAHKKRRQHQFKHRRALNKKHSTENIDNNTLDTYSKGCTDNSSNTGTPKTVPAEILHSFIYELHFRLSRIEIFCQGSNRFPNLKKKKRKRKYKSCCCVFHCFEVLRSSDEGQNLHARKEQLQAFAVLQF